MVAIVHLNEHVFLHPIHVLEDIQDPGPYTLERCEGFHILAIEASAEYDEVRSEFTSLTRRSVS